MEHYEGEGIVNIGVGEDISIADLARLVGEAVGYQGKIVYDASKPDGTPRKLVDTTKINALGWRAGISLPEGIRSTYQWFLENEV
jgi:GDP-L-fucose synthase